MLNFLIFSYLRALKMSCSAELSMKKFYNLKPSFACRGSYYFKLPRHKLQSTLDISNTDILNYILYQIINIGHISYISSNFNSCYFKLLVPQSTFSGTRKFTLRYQ